MRIVISIIVIIGLLFATVLGLGALLPAGYETNKMKTINISIDKAWEAITNIEDYPRYRDNYFAIRELGKRHGYMHEWQAFFTDGKMGFYQTDYVKRKKQFSFTLIKSNHKFSGHWDYYFAGDSLQCTIEIFEKSRMDDPIEKVFWYLGKRNQIINREFELLEQLSERK